MWLIRLILLIRKKIEIPNVWLKNCYSETCWPNDSIFCKEISPRPEKDSVGTEFRILIYFAWNPVFIENDFLTVFWYHNFRIDWEKLNCHKTFQFSGLNHGYLSFDPTCWKLDQIRLSLLAKEANFGTKRDNSILIAGD